MNKVNDSCKVAEIINIDGKESIRVGRNVNLLDLENKIDRYYSMIFE